MKGFIKTIEVVIASIIVLIVMSQFFFNVEREPWGKIFLKTSLEDAIISLHKTGELEKYVTRNDYNSFHKKLEFMMGGPYSFSIVVRDVPKPIIKVGCVCNDEELNILKSRLKPVEFEYSGRPTEIRINKTEIYSNEPDVFFYFNKTKFKEDKSLIKSKLTRGKGVILMSDLSESDMNDLSDIFGFSPKQTTKTNSNFSKAPETISFHISKIFTKVPFRVYTSGSTTEQFGYIQLREQDYEIKTFTNSTCENCLEYPVDSGKYYEIGETFEIETDAENYTLLVDKVQANSSIGDTFSDLIILNRTYTFKTPAIVGSDYFDGSILYNGENSLVTTNKMATWTYNSANNSDNNQLLKSLILYTAGESYRLDRDFFDVTAPSSEPPGEYVSVSYRVSGYEDLDPFEIIIRAWTAFS